MARNTVTYYTIPLFGIFSSGNAEEASVQEECHFCLDNVWDNDLYIMSTSCCHYLVHCQCFQRWLQMNHSTCAYCRTPFNVYDYCFICLKKRTENHLLRRTTCCGAVIDPECLQNLGHLMATLPAMAGFRCGHAVRCNRLLVKTSRQRENTEWKQSLNNSSTQKTIFKLWCSIH